MVSAGLSLHLILLRTFACDQNLNSRQCFTRLRILSLKSLICISTWYERTVYGHLISTFTLLKFMLMHYVGSITIQASALFYQACIYTNILYLVVTHEDDLHIDYSLLITHN